MTLLLIAVVTALAIALGMSSEYAEEAIRVAMMAKTLAALNGRDMDISKPVPTPPQGETPLPALTDSPSRLKPCS